MAHIKWEFENESIVFNKYGVNIFLETEDYTLTFPMNAVDPKITVTESQSNSNQENITILKIVGKSSPSVRHILNIEITDYEVAEDTENAILYYDCNDINILTFNIYVGTAKKLVNIFKALESNSPLPPGTEF